jgi:hypothetical protein
VLASQRWQMFLLFLFLESGLSACNSEVPFKAETKLFDAVLMDGKGRESRLTFRY